MAVFAGECINTMEYKEKRVTTASRKLGVIGIACGVCIAFLIVAAYHLAESPRFCASCHSMQYVTDTWSLSKHKQFLCVDCHIPPGNIYTKLSYKALRGSQDLFDEALRRYPATLTISPEGKKIANNNCLRCHYSTVENIPPAWGGDNCLRCHHYLVHGRGADKGGLLHVRKK